MIGSRFLLLGSPESFVSVDVLSDLLRTVRLSGGVFFNVTAMKPWVAAAPRSSHLAEALRPGTDHVIPYHVVIEGECFAGLLDGPKVRLKAGDVLVVPHGDPHLLSDSPEGRAVPDEGIYGGLRNVELPVRVEVGATGPLSARLVCGFLGCDSRPFNPLIESLPPVIHQNLGDSLDTPWLRHFLDVAVAESENKRAGGDAILARLSELMFVEVIRQYVESMPAGQSGWLAGLRDPAVARALSRLHGRPGEAWTLETLAAEVALSRSVLAERFPRLVGMPVMQYLTRWRMQVAAGLLLQSRAKIAEIALQVGYDSEAAFSRAFKKFVGTAPGAWRRRRDPEPLARSESTPPTAPVPDTRSPR
jgi:AraC-like DNA-binding protein